MKSKPGITLAVSHVIHLTREQRYALADGQPVDVQGVSLPIWYFKSRSSEPGVEVFNSYTLLHDPTSQIDIDQRKDGYTINVPYDLSPGQGDTTVEEKEIQTGKSLRDIRDGGSGTLVFNQYNRSSLKGMTIHVLHFIRIASLEELQGSLVGTTN